MELLLTTRSLLCTFCLQEGAERVSHPRPLKCSQVPLLGKLEFTMALPATSDNWTDYVQEMGPEAGQEVQVSGQAPRCLCWEGVVDTRV